MARRGIEKLRTKFAQAREVERERLMKIDESEERQAKRDRHIDEIGQRREFKFTKAQWLRIAAEMPGAQVDQYRRDIEIAAAWLAHRRQNPELSPGRRTPKRDKRLSEKIETAALNLFLGLSELSGFSRMRYEGMFGAGRQGEVFVDRPQRLAAFKADVARIAHYASHFLKAEQPDGLKLKGKADQARIVAWANASEWWGRGHGQRGYGESEIGCL
jgi:hypothetical protein